MPTLYKAVRLDHTSHWDKKTIWEAGKIIKPDSFALHDDSCGHGIHASEQLLDAAGYQSGPSDYCLVEPIGEIRKGYDKWRCESVRCLEFIEKDRLDKIAGFKLWESNHPVNPLLIDRDKTLGLEKLLHQWASVGSSARASVGDSVGFSVWASVGDSVGSSVWAYIGGLFPSIQSWKYAEKHGSDPWRPLLTLWNGGYVPSFYGKLWRLHTGEDAKVVLELTKDVVEASS